MWKVTFASSEPFTPISIRGIINDEYENLQSVDIVARTADPHIGEVTLMEDGVLFTMHK